MSNSIDLNHIRNLVLDSQIEGEIDPLTHKKIIYIDQDARIRTGDTVHPSEHNTDMSKPIDLACIRATIFASQLGAAADPMVITHRSFIREILPYGRYDDDSSPQSETPSSGQVVAPSYCGFSISCVPTIRPNESP